MPAGKQPSRPPHAVSGPNFRIAWRVVRELFGSIPAEKFGPKKLREVQAAMVTLRKKNGDGWCRKNINKQVSRIRLIFNWAVAEEIVPVQVAHALAGSLEAPSLPGRVQGRREGRAEAVAQGAP